QDQYAVVTGSAKFTVAAGGLNLTYQWNRDGEVLPGATESSLRFTNVQLGDAGNYTVTVANALGSVTSQPAALIVTNPTAPTILAQPRSQVIAPGGTARFSVTAF